MNRRALRLSTRLGITHGVLVALLLILLAVTLQGLLRMLGLITDIRDARLSTLDVEEEIHRTAWRIEVAMRHGSAACSAGRTDHDAIRAPLVDARAALQGVLDRRGLRASRRLSTAARRYLSLADRAPADGALCAWLLAHETNATRTALDEEMTDAWIDRMHELHEDIRAREEAARRIGVVTAATGLAFALIAGLVAALIARSTARSVADPIAALAREATRVGEGDFAPIPWVRGPAEVNELWRDLDAMRERLMELERLKQAFLANVSHELRSPLARLREALSLLADGTCGPLTPRQERVVALGVRACEREVRIVEALLDMSRLRSGVPLKREPVRNVDRVVQAAVEDERGEAVERGVEVRVTAQGSPPVVEIDPALVERVVANLVRNAVSVSARGAAVQVTRETIADAQGLRVRVDVTDDGPGLDDGIRAALFRPFAAAPVTSAGRPAGIGVGLAFAREVARAHGGDLFVATTSSRGTTFRLELPAATTEG